MKEIGPGVRIHGVPLDPSLLTTNLPLSLPPPSPSLPAPMQNGFRPDTKEGLLLLPMFL